MIEYSATSSISEIEQYYKVLTEEILISQVAENEKTVLLYLTDIAYNTTTQQALNPNGKSSNCDILGPTARGPTSPVVCVTVLPLLDFGQAMKCVALGAELVER
ncbi:MAG TPA: hypothetical protein PLN30_01720 [Ferruginibacter sp.]|nr:hypothetical protein [Ferruginibacter sp.]